MAAQAPAQRQLSAVEAASKRLGDLLIAPKVQTKLKEIMPAGLDPGRMVRMLMLETQKNPKILDCTPKSIIRALFVAGQLGLYPDSALGHAYLIPYGKDLQFITGYKGLITLAYRSAEVSHISANVVHEHDIFECVLGTEDKIHHVPCLKGDRGAPIAVYAVAHFKGRENYPAIEVLSPKDVQNARSRSRAKGGPWVTDELQMWRKTAIRKLSNYLPLSSEDQRALKVEAKDDDATIELNTDYLDLADGGELDVGQLAAEVGTAQTQANMVEKYTVQRTGGPTLELAEAYECCGGIEAHVESCPNFVGREPGDE